MVMAQQEVIMMSILPVVSRLCTILLNKPMAAAKQMTKPNKFRDPCPRRT